MDREKVIRLIDTLIFEAQNEQTWKVEALRCLKKELLKKQDAVVRCKDCKFLIDHYGFMNDGYCANMRDKYDVKFKPDKDWFCGDGVEKNADNSRNGNAGKL